MFEPVYRTHNRKGPTVTLTRHGTVTFNAAAVRFFELEDKDMVAFYWDKENRQLAIRLFRGRDKILVNQSVAGPDVFGVQAVKYKGEYNAATVRARGLLKLLRLNSTIKGVPLPLEIPSTGKFFAVVGTSTIPDCMLTKIDACFCQ